MDYLHEKVEESRHNETLAYLMFMAGAIFFVGGVIETMMIAENLDWFFFFPYKITPHVSSLLGLSLEFSGLTLLILGMILGIHYALEKSVYMNQLKGVYVEEKNIELKRYPISQGSTNPHGNPHNPNVKQHETKNATELEDCVKYLVDKRGFDRADAIYYCKTLGSQWQELVDEE
ncbi:MAG: hypothetical protein ACUVRA_06250 [Candidatus Bathyarchaeaceae archaeon]